MTTQRQQHDAPSHDVLVGERVHQLMWRAKISQTAFAPLLDLTQAGLSKKLRGERGWSVSELIAAASGLNTTVAYLVGETKNPQPFPTGGNNVGAEGLEPPTLSVKTPAFAEVIPLFKQTA